MHGRSDLRQSAHLVVEIMFHLEELLHVELTGELRLRLCQLPGKKATVSWASAASSEAGSPS